MGSCRRMGTIVSVGSCITVRCGVALRVAWNRGGVRRVVRRYARQRADAARQELASSFSPAMPATMHSMQPRRAAVAGSPNSTMPSSAVPTVPTPVHTA